VSVEPPVFSIVMPAFNAERTIGPAIRSALAQTRKEFELLVVDDGSTDRTADVVRSFGNDPRVVLIPSENRGPATARNLALARARGRYVSLLDSDDLYLPTYLADVEAALVADPRAGFAFPDAWVLDDRSGRIRHTYTLADYATPDPDPSAWLQQLVTYNVVHCMAMIPRAILERVGPFDERLRAAMDYELWLRIAAHGYGAVRIDRPLGVYRVTVGSITSQRRLVTTNLCEIYRIVAEEYEVADKVRALARGQLRRVQRERAVLERESSPRARLERATRFARSLVGAPRRAWRRRRLWYATPPEELDEYLRATGAL
jgi:glycosyltransferase involved in cell wall biosynthesis